jgi:hypothetical protein
MKPAVAVYGVIEEWLGYPERINTLAHPVPTCLSRFIGDLFFLLPFLECKQELEVLIISLYLSSCFVAINGIESYFIKSAVEIIRRNRSLQDTTQILKQSKCEVVCMTIISGDTYRRSIMEFKTLTVQIIEV